MLDPNQLVFPTASPSPLVRESALDETSDLRGRERKAVFDAVRGGAIDFGRGRGGHFKGPKACLGDRLGCRPDGGRSGLKENEGRPRELGRDPGGRVDLHELAPVGGAEQPTGLGGVRGDADQGMCVT